MLIKEAL